MNYKEKASEVVASIADLEWMYEVGKIEGIIAQALEQVGVEREASGYALAREEAANAERRAYESGARDMRERVDELETVCAELYQVVGVLACKHDDCFEHPDVQKALDNASDHALKHKDLLPFPSTPLPGLVIDPLTDTDEFIKKATTKQIEGE